MTPFFSPSFFGVFQLEDSQVSKEIKFRESSHQFAIPGEKIVKSSMTKGMAQSYETKLQVFFSLFGTFLMERNTFLMVDLNDRDHSSESDQQVHHQQHSMTTISRSSQERQTSVSRKSSEAHRSEVHIDSDRGGVAPDPFESSVHGREVHVAKQKQTQKEVKGQMEITRKITATETTEVEHKARTQERVVQGQVVSFNSIH